MKLLKKFIFSLMTMLLVLSVTAGIAFAAWSYKQEFEVADPTGTDREDLVVFTGINATALVNSGFMNSTGNNTDIQYGGTSIPYMFSDNDTLIYIESLGSNERQDYDLYLTYTPEKENFPILIGDGGYATIPDDPDLELSDNFSIEWRGYIDTTAGNNKYIVHKEDAIDIYVDNVTDGTIHADIYQDFSGYFNPTSHTDESSVWNNESYAYDDNVTSAANTTGADFLVLTPTTPRYCDSVRLYVGADNGTAIDPHVNLGIKSGGIWYETYNGTMTRDQWNTVDLDIMRLVTDARVEVSGGTDNQSWLYEFDFHALEKTVELEIAGVESGNHLVRVSADTEYAYLTVNTLWGYGTAENPYMIYDVDGLQEMSDNLSAYYVLACDIDASDTETWNGGLGFEPIGNSTTKFSGRFDGNGHRINDLYIDRPNESEVGLFGYTNGATLVNTYIDDSYIVGEGNVGALVGRAYNSDILNCHNNFGYLEGNENAGGLIGFLYVTENEVTNVEYCHSSATCNFTTRTYPPSFNGGFIGLVGAQAYVVNMTVNISHCYNSGNIYLEDDGTDDIGGFLSRVSWKGYSPGPVSTATISHCYNFGNIYVMGDGVDYVGGFMDHAYNDYYSYAELFVEDCCNSGDIYVYGTDCEYYGGFISSTRKGYTKTQNDTCITRCYNTGNIYGGGTDALFCAGGFVWDGSSDIVDCYSTGDVRSWTDPAGFAVYAGGDFTHCYSSGRVLQYTDNPDLDYYYSDHANGFIADVGSPILIGCFWDICESGVAQSYAGTGLSCMADELGTMASAGFDFSDDGDWEVVNSAYYMVNNGNPILKLGVCACNTVYAPAKSVPDTANNWIILYGNTTIYSEILSFDIDGFREATYEPFSIIENDILPDETNDHDATITWGTNPNISVTVGDFETPEEEPVPEDPIDPYVAPDDWIQECVYLGDLTPEIKEVINTAATDMGMSDPCSLWMIIIFGSTCAIALGVQVFTGSMLITGTTMIALLGFGSKVGIISGGFVLIIAITTFAIMYLLRHN